MISQEQYQYEKAIYNKAEEFWKTHATFKGSGWSSLSTAFQAHPDYTACTNEIRGRIEQYEVLTTLPDKLVAYIGMASCNGMGVDRLIGQTYPVTTWAGDTLGFATRGTPWRVRSYSGSHMAMFYARIGKKEYLGRGFGESMSINLRAASIRKNSNEQAITERL